MASRRYWPECVAYYREQIAAGAIGIAEMNRALDLTIITRNMILIEVRSHRFGALVRTSKRADG